MPARNGRCVRQYDASTTRRPSDRLICAGLTEQVCHVLLGCGLFDPGEEVNCAVPRLSLRPAETPLVPTYYGAHRAACHA
jgi:hypothetical protein